MRCIRLSSRCAVDLSASLRFTLVALACGICLAGCGGDTGGRLAMTGRVSFQGTPLANGVIELVSADGAQQTGATITKGDFSVPANKGLPPGKYTVRITATQESIAAPTGPPGPEGMTQKAKDLIPAEYNVKSTLTAEVSSGKRNHFVFDLK
jgi:hypothetical protein